MTTLSEDRRISREARSIARRAQALALRRSGATYAAISAALGLSLEQARQVTRQAEKLADHPHWTDSLPQRAINLLRNLDLIELSEVEAVRAVAEFSRRELLAQSNFGQAALAAVDTWLAKHRLELRSSP
jgi:hypothetical protein